MELLTILKSKFTTILCIVLFTLLTVSYLSAKSDRLQLTQAQDKLLEHVQLNKRLSDENLRLAKELQDAPKEYITVIKESSKEICNGEVKKEMINSLPSKKKEAVNENVNTVNTADIDDRLPPSLTELLK